SGDVTLNIRHDLPLLLNRAVGLLSEHRAAQERRFETYQRTEVPDAKAHDLMIRAVDGQVLPGSKIPKVLQEWRQPRHAEFRAGGKTAWRLFNAFTESLKPGLESLPKRTKALHRLLDRTCGLIIPAAKEKLPAFIDGV